MLKVDSIIGNIFVDKKFHNLQSKDFEKLYLSRIELEKRILRKKADRGTDIGLNLDPGVKLCNGDVIKNGDTIIIIKQLPEKIITVKFKNKKMTNVMVLLGHIIGNRHRPISIKGDTISFPIQADSEKEIFTKLFQNIINYIEMTIDEQIFLPNSGADVYEH